MPLGSVAMRFQIACANVRFAPKAVLTPVRLPLSERHWMSESLRVTALLLFTRRLENLNLLPLGHSILVGHSCYEIP